MPVAATGTEQDALGAKVAFKKEAKKNTRQAIALVGASYCVDIALIACYCGLGLVSWTLLACYAFAASVQCFVFERAIGSGWSKKLRDPTMANAQMVAGGTVQTLFIIIDPQLFALLAFGSFTLIAFGTLQLSIRANLFAWFLITVAVVIFFVVDDRRFTIPTETTAQRAIVVAAWAFATLRCSLIGSFGMALHDLIQRRQRQMEADARHLTDMAQRDALTGALNRRGILSALESAKANALDRGPGFAVALLDLDHFKSVNDLHGHPMGDAVLQLAAKAIASALRTGDTMGRYGGEEFVVVLHGLRDAEAALRAAERVRQAVAEQQWSQLVPGLAQTVSIGVSLYKAGDTVEEAIARADAAMYVAKNGGRNATRVG